MSEQQEVARGGFDWALSAHKAAGSWPQLHQAAQALYEATPVGERGALIGEMAAQIEAMIARV